MSSSQIVRLTTTLFLLACGAMPIMAEPPNALVENFDAKDGRLPAGWQVARGDWRVADGHLCVDATGREALITFGELSWQNYEIEASVTFEKVDNDSRWLAIVFRSGTAGQTPYSQYAVRFNSNTKNGGEFAVRLRPESWSVRKTAKVSNNSQLGRPRKLRVVVRGSNAEGYIDGRLVIASAYCVDRDTGVVGLAASGCVAQFDDVSVRSLPASPKLSEKKLKPCLVVGHRGFSAIAPENTLASAIKAIESGADGSECDVQASKDGALVVMHDDEVDRTTNGTGKLTEMTLPQLKKLDAGSWKDAKYAGERIPTLAELLAKHKNTKCAPVIEIKMEGISREVVDAIREAGMVDRAVVIAFSANVVKEVRAIEPKLRCAWLSSKEIAGTPAEQAQWIADQAAACDTKIVNIGYAMLSEEVIAELHQRGFTVWTWTVDEPAIADALMRWGIDGITTNHPDMVVKRQRAARSRTSE